MPRRKRSPRLAVVPPAPRNRPVCRGGLRPCPYVSCRHHLLIEVSEHGVLTMNRPKLGPGRPGTYRVEREDQDWFAELWIDAAVEALFQMEDTCSLDVADRGVQTHKRVGKSLGITKPLASVL